jgi:hypothetical protein
MPPRTRYLKKINGVATRGMFAGDEPAEGILPLGQILPGGGRRA